MIKHQKPLDFFEDVIVASCNEYLSLKKKKKKKSRWILGPKPLGHGGAQRTSRLS